MGHIGLELMAKIVGSKKIVESVARIANNKKSAPDNDKPSVEEYPEGDLQSLARRVLNTLHDYQVKLRSGMATEGNKKSSVHKQR